MQEGPASPFFVGSLITSVVGAALLLATDFAGWSSSTSGGGITVEASGYIGLLTVYFPLIAVLSGTLLYCGYVSFMALRHPEQGPDPRYIDLAYKGSVAVFATVLVGALVFATIMLTDEPDDWWLDSGFYGGTIGALLTAVLLRVG
ncbi:MAG: hypothetical protein IIC85_15540, partial [Chloroflexi bacterium]|nr:hypothetical protein [Chloroflexota bacterium]